MDSLATALYVKTDDLFTTAQAGYRLAPNLCEATQQQIEEALADVLGVGLSFEVELALEGLVDRLDDLPQRFEQL